MKKKFRVIDRKGWWIPEFNRGYNWKETGEEDAGLVESAVLARVVVEITEIKKVKSDS